MSISYSKGDEGALPLFKSTPEITTPVELVVTGQIPKWVAGALFRTGPGGYEIKLDPGVKYRGSDTYTFDHWFDGLGQAHSFLIKDGKVSYRSKNLTETFTKEIAAKGGSLRTVTFAQHEKSTMKKFTGFVGVLAGSHSPEPADPTKQASSRNVSVTISPDFPVPSYENATLAPSVLSKSEHPVVPPQTLVTKTDASDLQELDPITLEPRRLFNYSDLAQGIAGHGPLSGAHHQYDPETDEYFNYTLAPGRIVKHEVFSVPGQSGKTKPRLLASSEYWTASYIHAFYLTKRYVILPFYPYHLTAGGITILWHGNLNSGLQFHPNKPTLFRVIDRTDANRGHIATYRAPASFAFHTINAQEVGDDLVLDVVSNDDATIVSDLYLDKIVKGGPIELSKPRRYTLKNVSKQPLPGKDELPSTHLASAEVELLGSVEFDLPRWNPVFRGTPIRYAYGISRTPELIEYLLSTKGTPTKDLPLNPLIDALSKADFVTKSHKLWNIPGCYPSEPLFVPRPGGTDEDDGVILSVVYDSRVNSSFLLILDAKKFEEVGRASFGGSEIGPHTVCLGFHGAFYNDSGERLTMD